ncbi:DNA-binding HxlR family transcriptional regulator [Kibdelosporangium banguiense]|uniref:DNA-binding HxlR family transcriptional regulator n=1 Tax=Kibdelosporangium banguiense TaxID=1365924 RepID=A0ABS4TPU8_9PSEU|nr:helix-turn-helix domain-containing protein [Kibdelosporangium banguiense]MBP2325958.1 DNA-binding HxlR family transcriptional regulator [Kibdelosporangium banguiense]
MSVADDTEWDRDAWDLDPDSAALALAVFTPSTTAAIMREALYGTRRFEDFLRRTGISPSVLAARLRELVAQNVLVKRPYQEPGARAREEYCLTEKGRDVAPAVIALINWADRWLSGDRGPTVVLNHRDCGAPIETVMMCAHGHELRAVRDVAVAPGPGARPRT